MKLLNNLCKRKRENGTSKKNESDAEVKLEKNINTNIKEKVKSIHSEKRKYKG